VAALALVAVPFLQYVFGLLPFAVEPALPPAPPGEAGPVLARVGEVLLTVGRMKYLRPLYNALGKHPRTRALAKEIYAAGREGYHSLSRRVIESIIEKYSTDEVTA